MKKRLSPGWGAYPREIRDGISFRGLSPRWGVYPEKAMDGVCVRGFTLIELLVVITILAVLAGAALPYVQGYVEDSRVAKAKTDLDEISRAITVYEIKEGDYSLGDVSLLTGRYLNKSSTDPWGSVYKVATNTGIVYSMGPDKTALNDDDIKASYQPPLALVSAKWVDANQSGTVDKQSPADKVILSFSRRILITLTNANLLTDMEVPNTFSISSGSMVFGGAATTNFGCGAGGTGPHTGVAAPAISSSRKEITLTVAIDGGFVIKSDTIKISSANTVLKDEAGVLALSEQAAVIIPQ